MKPRKTPPTRGLVAVVWHGLLCILFSLGECLHASEDGQKFGLDWRGIIGTSMRTNDVTLPDFFVSLNQTGKLAPITMGKMPAKLFGFAGDNIIEWIDSVHLPANQSKKTISSIVELAPSVADQRELVTEEKSDQSGKQSPNKQDRRIAGDIMKILIHGVAFFVIGFLFGSLPGSSSTRRKNSLHNV